VSVHGCWLVSDAYHRSQDPEQHVAKTLLCKVGAALARALDADTMMQMARACGFCQRMRSVAPREWVVAVIAAMATQHFARCTHSALNFLDDILLHDGSSFAVHDGYVLIRHQTRINPRGVRALMDGEPTVRHEGQRLHDFIRAHVSSGRQSCSSRRGSRTAICKRSAPPRRPLRNVSCGRRSPHASSSV
jgi:hypothetical protein